MSVELDAVNQDVTIEWFISTKVAFGLKLFPVICFVQPGCLEVDVSSHIGSVDLAILDEASRDVAFCPQVCLDGHAVPPIDIGCFNFCGSQTEAVHPFARALHKTDLKVTMQLVCVTSIQFLATSIVKVDNSRGVGIEIDLVSNRVVATNAIVVSLCGNERC